MNMEKDFAGYPRQIAPHLTLRRVLGEGGTSVVFEAFHTRLKVPVAIKVLAVSGSVAEQARLRLRREAELYAMLDNPRIPRVYDVDELPDGTPYVVMEFVPGASLETLLMRGPLSPHRAVMITREVLAALVYVHARGVLHRDVKPANVILNETGDRCQVRLVDFGIAKAAFDEASEEALTQQGTLVGTPHYMAPERLLGRESDAKGDTYAVGVMLYEMLTGQVPFGGPTLGEVIASVLRDIPRPLRTLCPHISSELEQVVVTSMARDPAYRYASAADMLAAIERVEASMKGDVSSPRIVPPSRPLSSMPPPTLDVLPDDLIPGLRRRNRHLWPVLGAAALGLAVWAAWPSEVRDLRVQGEPKVAPAEQAPAAAAPTVQEPAAVPTFAAVPPEELPSHPPSAGVLADPPAGEPPAQPLLDQAVVEQPSPNAEAVAAPAEPEPVQATDNLVPPAEPSAEQAQDKVMAAPQERPNNERGGRRAARARAPSSTSTYQPVRAVPLQPVLEQLDTLLKDPPAAKVEPKERRSSDGQRLPENPY